MEGGYFSPERFSSRVYTFGTKGDTLCLFTVNDAEDYVPVGDYRSAETDGQVYVYGGKPRFLLGYDDTVYELEDASTLKAVWKLDFGDLKRPTGKYVVESLSRKTIGSSTASWKPTAMLSWVFPKDTIAPPTASSIR